MLLDVHCLAVPPLRRVRRLRLLTQHELAARSGISQGTIARIESGKRPAIRVSTIRDLADALGVDPMDVDEFRRVLEALDAAAEQ